MKKIIKRFRSIFLYTLSFFFAASVFTDGVICRAATLDEQTLTASEQAYIEEGKTLRVGFVQDRIPVSFTDETGSLAGISRYIFDRIAQISGLSFEYVPLPEGAVTYDYLMKEQLDLVTSVEYNKENQGAKGIMISEPYLSSRKVIVARKDSDFSLDANLSVAICSGSQTIKKVLKETYPNYTAIDYDTINDCFTAVKEGDADVMILNQYVVEYWLHKPIYEDLKVIPILGLDDQLCFSAVVPFDENGEPVGDDGSTLISILNKAIEQIPADEIDSYSIQAIMENRYTFTPSDFLYRYQFALLILVISGILIAGLIALLLKQRIQSVEARADAKAKSQFLSTMSHEVRTPLNGLIGLNYLMSRRLHDPKQLEKYLEQSTMTAKYLLSLVSDILDMSLLHNEDLKLEQKHVDLRTLFSTVEAIVQGGMAEKKLHFQMITDLPYPDIIGDGLRIQQILLNLLDNSRKFTPEGGSVTLTVRQSAEGEEIRTQIEVADTGKGMSPAFQKNIFDVFSQERDTVSKGDQGVGLGLSICHRLAKLMKGSLEFVSELDKGSTFRFSFPAKPSEAPQLPEESPIPAFEEKPRILVAEDNELNGEILMELLEENGFDAELAVNGQSALKLFSDSNPGEYGIILMDLLMPEMDGYQAASAIRALDRPDAKTVQIFACSANCTVEDRNRAFACGMDDFLSKPIDVDVLIRKLSRPIRETAD